MLRDKHGVSSSSTGIIVLALACCASILLLWNLGEKYLWQDEACTAVLSQRLLKFGKPLAYDGVNLLTTDNFLVEDERTIDTRTATPDKAVDYYVRRGDLKADTTWKWQPWGQFVVAAASLRLLGNNTLAARLPFALAGVATVLLLFFLVRRHFGSVSMATIASVLLALNAFWILHARQCRYYSLSSLFFVLTLIGYAHWQWSGKRWSSLWFVLAAWGWFQVDYGTFWPVCFILLLDALLAAPTKWRSMLPVWTAMVIGIGPFVFFYELAGRMAPALGTFGSRFWYFLASMNHFIVPIVILVIAVLLVVWRWRILPSAERRFVAVSCAVLTAMLLWSPSVAPEGFLRYIMIVAPAGCLLSAWVVVRGGRLLVGREALVRPFAMCATVLLVVTPWMSLPLSMPLIEGAQLIRSPRLELVLMMHEVFGTRPDPNRIVIDWLRQHASPSDEILINYEDIPLMFYLPNPIRGGLAAFRVEDDTTPPPRFLILRKVPFTHWSVFKREINRHRWVRVPVSAPDIPWGNNPDPYALYRTMVPDQAPLLVLERMQTP